MRTALLTSWEAGIDEDWEEGLAQGIPCATHQGVSQACHEQGRREEGANFEELGGLQRHAHNAKEWKEWKFECRPKLSCKSADLRKLHPVPDLH